MILPIGKQPISVPERTVLNVVKDLLRRCSFDKVSVICDRALDWKGNENLSDTYRNILAYIKTLPESKVKEAAEELNQWLM